MTLSEYNRGKSVSDLEIKDWTAGTLKNLELYKLEL